MYAKERGSGTVTRSRKTDISVRIGETCTGIVLFFDSILNTICKNKQVNFHIRVCIQKFPDWPLGARTVSGTAICY